MSDSIFLMKSLNIQSSEELFNLMEKYTSTRFQTARTKNFTLEAFEKYKEELAKDVLQDSDKMNKKAIRHHSSAEVSPLGIRT